MKVLGYGFTQRKDKEGKVDKKRNKMFVRFVDPDTKEPLAPTQQVSEEDLNNDDFEFNTPQLPDNTKSLM